jgi:hypothetical protein
MSGLSANTANSNGAKSNDNNQEEKKTAAPADT